MYVCRVNNISFSSVVAFLTWPDVRPPHLVSTFVKLLEIKWSVHFRMMLMFFFFNFNIVYRFIRASLFNLTVKSMRSSLGLTLLHTAMFSANSEVVFINTMCHCNCITALMKLTCFFSSWNTYT